MYGDNYGYRSGLNMSMVQHLARKAGGLEALVRLSPGDVVLDIGSNDGTLLGSYTTDRIRRVGIDPTAKRFASYYPADAEIVPEFFSAESFRTRLRSACTDHYVGSDVLRPRGSGFLRPCRTRMPRGGWRLAFRAVVHAIDAPPRRHTTLSVMSTSSTTRSRTSPRILARAGLEMIDVRFNRVNGGSFAVTATHPGSSLPRQGAVVEWLTQPGAAHPPRHADAVSRVRGARVPASGRSRRPHPSPTRRQELRSWATGRRRRAMSCCSSAVSAQTTSRRLQRSTSRSSAESRLAPASRSFQSRRCAPRSLTTCSSFLGTSGTSIVDREIDYLRQGGKLIFPLPEIEIVGS